MTIQQKISQQLALPVIGNDLGFVLAAKPRKEASNFVALAECGGYNRTIVIEAEQMYPYGAMAWLANKFVCSVP